jgi:UDP-glucuronate 4-epimerase
VIALDKATDPHRLKLIISEDDLAKVNIIPADITDLTALIQIFQDTHPTHVIHLAGLQVPFCRANPSLGAIVNVVGTVNMFEAAKKIGLRHLVYASSIAVYGLSEEYPEGAVAEDAPLKPRSHYGVYKQANEGTARVYWLDDKISSIGLRPYTVYGPGRDQGMTSSPTKAMLAAAAGKPYHISFGGRVTYQFAEDTARIFIQAARTPINEAHVFNLSGNVVDMPEIIQTIESVVPAAQGKITFENTILPFPEDMDDTPLRTALGSLEYTSLQDGIAATVDIFRKALSEGQISADQ